MSLFLGVKSAWVRSGQVQGVSSMERKLSVQAVRKHRSVFPAKYGAEVFGSCLFKERVDC